MISLPLPLSNSLLFFLLIGITLKDLKDRIIPDVLLIMVGILGFLRFGSAHLISFFILGGGAYGLYWIYLFLRGQEGLGLGDVKMMAVSGLWLDPLHIPFYVALSGGIGVGIGLLWRVFKREPRFPLGPALALALGICIVGTDGFSKGGTMTTDFSGPHLPPASGGKPDSIVVFLHGYGANGHDLLSIGEVWASLLPNTLFVAPHGPTESRLYPSGNQWFSLHDWNPDQPLTATQIQRMLGDIKAITPSFNQYLDTLLKTYNLPPERLAFVGFSQGSMFALYVALQRPRCAGVVAYSGAFLEDSTNPTVSSPPILLIHGQEDRLVPPRFSQIAEERLKNLQIPVTLVLIPGVEHGIDEKGLALGGAFLKKQFNEKLPSGLWEKAKESTS